VSWRTTATGVGAFALLGESSLSRGVANAVADY
jgi:hypothetical protein